VTIGERGQDGRGKRDLFQPGYFRCLQGYDMRQAQEYKLPIIYDVLLTVMPAVFLLGTFIYNRIAETDWFMGLTMQVQNLWYNVLVFLPMILILIAAMILGVRMIIEAVHHYQDHDELYCLNAMLIIKYGLMIHFIVLAIIMFNIMTLGYFALSVATAGIGFFTLPFFIMLIPAVAVIVFLEMIPGSVYGVAVALFTREKEQWGIPVTLLHCILQFVYIADVLDALYLSVAKWGRGKKSAIFTAVVYLIALICSILLIRYIVDVFS
jgi:hypothetical protein